MRREDFFRLHQHMGLDKYLNQRPPAELGIWGRPLEGVGATLCWWSLILTPLISRRHCSDLDQWAVITR
jgi:hypothetical protein